MSDAYAALTARVLDALERGTAPWRRPWHETSGAPANALTNRPYRGVNVVLLGLEPYRDHRWLTFRQALELGGKVRKGERSTEIAFWKPIQAPAKEEGEEARRAPLLRLYRVFNVEQCEGLRLPPAEWYQKSREDLRIPRAEATLGLMPDPPSLRPGCEGAWYAPVPDEVGMPEIGAFVTPDAYYATLFHEMGHATGHVRRLDRPGVTGTFHRGAPGYAREELVAELASAFVCAAIGLDDSLVENSAAYVAGWLRALTDDPRAFVSSAGQAQRAADWVFGRTLPLAG